MTRLKITKRNFMQYSGIVNFTLFALLISFTIIPTSWEKRTESMSMEYEPGILQ